MTFASLGLAEPILGGVRAAGYEKPTDIQAHAIPLLLENRDLIGLGQTGSGKTAAFGLPILNRLLDGERGLRALILVPTRELCVQVAENLRVYASRTELAVCTAFGGIPLSIQESAFKRGLDVLVACPGRLLDHLERGNVSLQNVEVVVLDEADRMLDMGFLPQIRRILVRCPPRRQTLLFSATMPPEMEQLCSDFLPDAEIVQVGRRSQAAPTIAHEFVQVGESEKARALEDVLRRERGRVLIFVKTKVKAEQLGRRLRTSRLPADSIHGDKSAEARHTVLRSFDGGRTRFLVATDVAARGIDVDDIALVVNYDMPRAMEDYIHRVGRTGRAGSSGRAVSFCTPADRGLVATIRQHLERTAPERAAAGNTGTPAAPLAESNGAPAAARRERSDRRSAPVEPRRAATAAPPAERRRPESRHAEPRRADSRHPEPRHAERRDSAPTTALSGGGSARNAEPRRREAGDGAGATRSTPRRAVANPQAATERLRAPVRGGDRAAASDDSGRRDDTSRGENPPRESAQPERASRRSRRSRRSSAASGVVGAGRSSSGRSAV